MFGDITSKLKESLTLIKRKLLLMDYKTSPLALVDKRCKKCNRLLGRFRGTAEVKCDRCNTLNTIST